MEYFSLTPQEIEAAILTIYILAGIACCLFFSVRSLFGRKKLTVIISKRETWLIRKLFIVVWVLLLLMFILTIATISKEEIKTASEIYQYMKKNFFGAALVLVSFAAIVSSLGLVVGYIIARGYYFSMPWQEGEFDRIGYDGYIASVSAVDTSYLAKIRRVERFDLSSFGHGTSVTNKITQQMINPISGNLSEIKSDNVKKLKKEFATTIKSLRTNKCN